MISNGSNLWSVLVDGVECLALFSFYFLSVGKDGGLFGQKVKSSDWDSADEVESDDSLEFSGWCGVFFFFFLRSDQTERLSWPPGRSQRKKKKKPLWPLSRPLRFSCLHQVCKRVHAKVLNSPLKRPPPHLLRHHQLAPSPPPTRGFEAHVRGIIEEARWNFLFIYLFSKSDIPEPRPDSMAGFYTETA